MKPAFKKYLLGCAAFTALTLSMPAMAQETSSSLRGNVVDETGKPLANVSIEIIHVPTGTTRNVATNDSGKFSARGLLVGGPYMVRLADGTEYKAASIEDMYTQLGQTQNVSLVAKVAADMELDEIVAVGTRIEGGIQSGSSRNFSISDILKTTAIDRDLKSIIQKDPKIAVDNTVDGGPGLSIAGSNIRFNSLTIDGIAQNDNFGLNKNGYPTRRAPISLDAIEAIQVNMAPFEVTYGSFLGGNINIVTKTGTNEFHGSGFFEYSDDGLAGSSNSGDQLNIGTFTEKTYGATLSGPIIKDKLFFFAAYEKYETTESFPFQLDSGSGSSTEILGVTQADVDRAVQISKDVYGYDALGFNADNPVDDEKIIAKINWNINDSHRLSATYQRAEGSEIRDFFTSPTTRTAALLSNRYTMKETLTAYSAQLFSDWSDNFSTEIKFGKKIVDTRQESVSPDSPAMTISTAGGGTIRLGPDQFRHANELDNDTRFIKVKGDYYLGDHTITAGYEQEKTDVDNLFVFWSKGEFSFNSLDDYENRNSGFTIYNNAFSGNPDDAAAVFSITTHAFYLQDEWNPTDNLTLYAGMRFEVNSNDDFPAANADFQTRNGFSNQENLDGKKLWLPRIGFNYTLDDRTTVRGGAGIFGGGAPTVWLSNSYANTGVLSAAKFGFFGPGEPEAVAAAISGTPDATSAATNLQQFLTANPEADTNGIAPDFKIPSSWKFNLAIDHEFDLSSVGMGDGWNVTLEAIWTSVNSAVYWRESRRQQIGAAPDGRPLYDFPAGFDLILESTDQGHGAVYSLDIGKSWDTDNLGRFDLNLGYAYQDIKEVNPGNAFIAFEGFGQPATSDRNAQTLFNSEFEIKNRITANLSWQKEIFGDNTTAVNLFYTGRSGRHFSYTFGRTFLFGGTFLSDFDGLDSQSLYVPSGAGDALVVDNAASAALNSYVDGDECLSEYKGSIIPRHACTSGWVNRFDLHFSQEVKLPGLEHGLEFTFDIQNLGNLINNSWGRVESYLLPFNVPLVDVGIEGGQYEYSNFRTQNQTVAALPSVWKMQFGIHYRF